MYRLILGITCGLFLGLSLAVAQDNSPAPTDPAKATPSPPPAPVTLRQAEEVQPPVFHLKDKDGRLLAVPGFSFETFMELYKLKNELEQPVRKPRYSLQRIAVTGKADAERADLAVEYRILLDSNSWVRVPLRLEQGVLSEPALYEGKGEYFVHFEEGEGYVGWLHGEAGQEHRLTLHVLVPLTKIGDATRLRLGFPRATASELMLNAPLADALAKVSEGAALRSAVATGNTTLLTIVGLASDFELTWRPADARVAEGQSGLEVVGATLARLDSRGIDWESTLTVRSYSDPFDRFHVRLPRGAVLTADSTPSYTLSMVAAKGGADRVVEVRLARKTTGPWTLKLAARRNCDPAKPDEWFELCGFEVVESARQWGHVAVGITGDWRVLWGPERSVRRTDQWPDSLRYDDVVAGFEYSAQPCSLTARLVTRQTHIGVEPEYLILIDPEQARLEARLKYSIRGAKAFAVEVNLLGWEFDQVEPESLITADAVAVSSSGVVSIPLAQPTTGQMELVLRAHRPIAKGATTLTLPLPQPQPSSLEPATVVVLPADNVELVPGSPGMVGLSRQQVAPPMQLPDRQQEPLVFQAEGTKATFACGMRIHIQAVTVNATSQLSVDARVVHVEQRLVHTITYEPLDRLELDVPRAVLGAEGFSLQVDDQTLVPVPAEEKGRSKSPTTRLLLPLPKAYLGTCELVVRYTVPMAPPISQTTTVVPVPLVMSALGKLSKNRLNVVPAAGISARPQDAFWTRLAEESFRPGRSRGQSWESAEPTPQASLAVVLESQEPQRATVIERAWVQTWLTPRATRQDRAVFRFVSNEREIEVTLPDGVVQGQLLAMLDGKPVIAQSSEAGHVVFALPTDESTRPRRLELRYHFAEGQFHRGWLNVELPRIGRDVWIRRVYWQLVVPRNEHVAVEPAGWTRESTWGWSNYFFERRPVLEQSQLETWVGVAHQSLLPSGLPESTNRYLFSNVGPVGPAEVFVVGRTWIVLFASGGVLLLGLLAIYLPVIRHPAVLLMAAVALAYAGLVYPEPTLMIAQAASLGLGLGLFAAVLERLARHYAGPAAPVEPPPSPLEKKSTQIFRPAPSVGGSLPSSESKPASPPPGSLDWQP